MSTLKLRGNAGHHFYGEGDLSVAYHCTYGKRQGIYCERVKFIDGEKVTWDRWFEWPEDQVLHDAAGGK